MRPAAVGGWPSRKSCNIFRMVPVSNALFCAEPDVELAHARLRAVLAAKPDRPAAQKIAHHDPVSVTLADRNLINADHLRTRRARSCKLGFHVLLVEGLDRVPVQIQIRRYVLDCRGSSA